MSGAALPTLVVRAPSHRRAELEWVCEILLRRRLGLEFRIAPGDDALVELDCGRGTVCWPDVFLATVDKRWLHGGPAATPSDACWPLPGADWRTRAGFDEVWQLFGDGVFELAPTRIRLPLDLSGSAFFMLSRYEEACDGAARDRHGRFPAAAAAAVRAGWLQRPCVDEWVELLASALRRFWPDWLPPAPAPEVWVSCDVDLPYSPSVHSARRALRQVAAHLVRERQPMVAAAAIVNPLLTRLGWTLLDPYDTFDWMMAVNEAVGQRLTFFFICTEGQSEFEGFYRIDEPRIAGLVRRICDRGHEVGLHASYASIDDPGLLAGELLRLRTVAGHVGAAEAFGARQHYLRWQAARTPAQLDAARIAYDASLGHAEVPGFRCGTCHAFPLFDLERGRALDIEERPLVLMEASVMSSSHQGLGHGEAARAAMLTLKDTCRRFGGCFSLLWHNSMLTRGAERRLYRELIRPFAS